MPSTKTKETKDVVSIQDQLRAELETLKERVDPPSGFTVTTKGKVFTLPDGSSDEGPMTCVILDWISVNTYFKNIYNPKQIEPPACFALARNVAELRPSKQAPEPQHATCKGCDQNDWGSAGGGRKGKACKNKRRLLIAPIDADEETVPWCIHVSPTGLKHFDKYVTTLGDMGKHPIEAITDMYFEPAEAFPSLRFKVKGAVENLELFWALKERGQDILFAEPNIESDA